MMSTVIGIQTTVLSLIIILILFGNGLVIASVLSCRKLRSVTNLFTVSLAVADVALALLVLPPSVIYLALPQEVGWPFGWTVCRFWMSCDVTCCTASIIHLCLISLDRYIAITDPLRYKVRMPKMKAYLAITSAWLVSMAISFVPIFLDWFSDKTNGEIIASSSSSSSSSSPSSSSSFNNFTNIDNVQIMPRNLTSRINILVITTENYYSSTILSLNSTDAFSITTTDPHLREPFICAIKPNTVYAVISASTSFYLPLLVMTIFYSKIYRIAQQQRNGIRSQSVAPQVVNTSNKTLHTSTTPTIISMFMKNNVLDLWKKKSTVHCNIEVSSVDSIITEHFTEGNRQSLNPCTPTNLTLKPAQVIYERARLNQMNDIRSRQSPLFDRGLHPYVLTVKDRISMSLTDFPSAFARQDGARTDKSLIDSISQQNLPILKVQDLSQNTSTNYMQSGRSSDCLSQISGLVKPRQKSQGDHKAIKTLGVLMGVFCTCWLPFFMMYLILPFCDLRACLEMPKWLEDFLTWLGYCNSLFNPCVYALTNRDFKEAYWRLIRLKRCSF